MPSPLQKMDAQAVIRCWPKIEKDTANYVLAEDDLNVLGYDFLNAGMDTAAYEKLV